MRPCLIFLFVATSLLSQGCAMFNAGKDLSRSTAQAFTPNPRDYQDGDIGTGDDSWTEYGVNARSETGTTKLNDPIGKFGHSDKAKSIEESLGFEYE